MDASENVSLSTRTRSANTMSSVRMTWPEGLRKLAHMAAFWPALLLPYLSPAQAMGMAFALVIMNVFILPKAARILYRSEEPGMGALEIVLYPAALMACVAAFGIGGAMGKPAWYLPAAAAWFGLACVDAFIGIACRIFPNGPAVPWNPRKPVFAVCIGAAAACLPAWLLARWALPEAFAAAPASSWPGCGWLLGLVSVCALAETAWFGIADNVVIPFALSLAISLFPTPLAAADVTGTLPKPLWIAVWALLAAHFGLASFKGRLLTAGGALLGALLAFVLMLAEPWLFAFLGGFFVLGNVATRFGLKHKQSLGIAEARGGRRGAAEVFGAMGLAAWMTPLVHLSQHKLHGALLVCIAPLVAKTMDTVSSEIGKALAGRTVSLKSFRMVPPGTEGGVSLGGTLSGLAAAALLALPILALGWGGWEDAAALLVIALLANLFESYWGEWAGRRGMDQGAHTNVLMTLVAAVCAWVWWFGLR
jgi:uncharacterized protein (TIGR00297 family)